jgi:alcohol dehydrogenase class IV
VKQREYCGFGKLEMCGSMLANISAKNVLLVTGRKSYIQSGAKERLEKVLDSYDVSIFNDFEPNPKIENVHRGIEYLRSIKYDAVLAVGGGSIIDMAKMVNFFGANDVDPAEYLECDSKVIRKGKPLIAIPTTAGSGSEVTHFAVLYITRRKYSVAHKYIIPDFSVVDPTLTESLSSRQTAISGMDALCQAIESYWSVNSIELSKMYARRAIELIISNLTQAVNNPTKTIRVVMAKAAHLAGKAINITKTSAPHSISYPLTAYFDISHGHAVGLTLPSMMVYNYGVNKDILDRRGSEYVKKTLSEIACLIGAENVHDAKKRMDSLMSDIGLERKLSQLGVSSTDAIEKIIEDGFAPDRVSNNPRLLTPTALRNILHEIY